jgi:hypothetical protein
VVVAEEAGAEVAAAAAVVAFQVARALAEAAVVEAAAPGPGESTASPRRWRSRFVVTTARRCDRP